MRRILTLLLLLLFVLPCLGQERWGRDGSWGRADPRWGRGLKAWTLTDLDYIVDWWRIEYGITKDGSDLVSSWLGSINGIDLAQTTGANQPKWTADQINGHPAVVFSYVGSGDNDALQGVFGADYAQPNTVIIVCSEPTDDGNDRALFDGDDATHNHRLYTVDASNKYFMFGGTPRATTYPMGGTGFKIFSVVFNGGSSVLRVNGTDYSPVANVGTDSFDALTLGAGHTGGFLHSDIKVTDVVIINAGLGTGNLQRAERWLNVHRDGVY